jgi:hypothetical protein
LRRRCGARARYAPRGAALAAEAAAPPAALAARWAHVPPAVLQRAGAPWG